VVKERTKELGIRKAIGATPRSIVLLIMLEAVLITALSGYFGLVLAIGILKAIGPTLEAYFILNPGVSTSTVLVATMILIIAGVIAGYVPAKRAAKIKPIAALRAD
jgi:putative ABC transport system permease protein